MPHSQVGQQFPFDAKSLLAMSCLFLLRRLSRLRNTWYYCFGSTHPPSTSALPNTQNATHLLSSEQHIARQNAITHRTAQSAGDFGAVSTARRVKWVVHGAS